MILIRVPGSKSMTHRVLVAAALAEGVSTLGNVLVADDTRATIEGLRTLGVPIRGGTTVTVEGHGAVSGGSLHVGSSGTTARLLSAVAALAREPVEIDGSAQMRRRPMGGLFNALRALGATIDGDRLPATIRGPVTQGGALLVDAGETSQYVSALALIGPMLREGLDLAWTRLVSKPYVELTLSVMSMFGASAELEGDRLLVAPGGYLANDAAVVPDASSAVFVALAAALTGREVAIPGLTRTIPQPDLAAFDALAEMGVPMAWEPDGVRVVGGRPLIGIDVDLSGAPDGAIAVAVAAAFADGPSRIRPGAWGSKESDRFASVAALAAVLGADAEVVGGVLVVRPRAKRGGGTVEVFADHRIAMAGGVAAMAKRGVRIRGAAHVAKSWPTFFSDLAPVAPPGWARVAADMGVVAIDGPGGSGKTTVAREVARRLGWSHLDTGAFYRAATLAALRSGAHTRFGDLARSLDLDYRDGHMYLNGEDVTEAIRSPQVDALVSAVSADPDVRRVMVDAQRAWVTTHGGNAVVEGRDIGTVVFPDADVKVFLTARPEVRAARRARERAEAEAGVAEQLQRRDQMDSARAVSPLRPAEDAITIDTSDMPAEAVVDRIVELVRGG